MKTEQNPGLSTTGAQQVEGPDKHTVVMVTDGRGSPASQQGTETDIVTDCLQM